MQTTNVPSASRGPRTRTRVPVVRVAAATSRAKAHLQSAVAEKPELAQLLDRVQSRELDPLSAVREILQKVFHVPADGDATNRTDTR